MLSLQLYSPDIDLKVLYTSEGFKWEKEELMDVLHWWKQIVALALGIVCGAVPFVHMSGLLIFVAIMGSLTVVFYRSYLG